MHPEVIIDKPGKCPLCGMTLVSLSKPKDGATPSPIRKVLLILKNVFMWGLSYPLQKNPLWHYKV